MSRKIKVNSSNLEFVQYIADRSELRLWFLNEKNVIYAYSDVSEKIYSELIAASSVGGYFADHIKYKYEFKKTRDDTKTVEEKKTLSDKIVNHGQVEENELYVKDVKEAIKDIKAELVVKKSFTGCYTQDHIEEVINKRIGKRLM